MTSLASLTAADIVGSSDAGVQALFPKQRFDTTSRPLTRANVEALADNALIVVRRLVRDRGYDPAQISLPDHLAFVRLLVIYHTAAKVEHVLDQGKDPRTENRYEREYEKLADQFGRDPDPFPEVVRRWRSDPGPNLPDRMVRGPLPTVGEIDLDATRPLWSFNETPTGPVDGVNQVFALARQPYPPGSLLLLLNGQILMQPTQYTVAGNIARLAVPPAPGSVLLAYMYAYVV